MAASTHHSRTDLLYYLILPSLILSCLGLTIGLTYAPCYSAMCVESYFPTPVRGHIGLFYGMLVGIGIALGARARWEPVRNFFEWHPAALDKIMLVTGKRVSMGALLLVVWVAGLSFGSTGYWYPAENAFWMARGELAGWTRYIFRVVWTGVTGHWIDLWIGLVVLPVGRNSVLGRVFQLHSSTLLFAHKTLAYSLAVVALVHGFLYYSFLGAYVANTSNQRVKQQFNPDNPGLTWHEAEVRGIYSWLCLPSGALCGLVLIPIMVITSLPVLRRINYNTFYFMHLGLAALVMIFVSIHASTGFYCLLPGLVLWVGDWAWRVQHALGRTTSVQVEATSNGWYRIRLPATTLPHLKDVESGRNAGHPLVSYSINLPKVSRLELHRFTVATYDESRPVVLVQKSVERKTAEKTEKEWTWKLAAMMDHWGMEKPMNLDARIEGPYVESVAQYHKADHVLAIGGGSGITGAISLANFWLANDARNSAKFFTMVWTVRDHATSQLHEMDELRAAMAVLPNAKLVVHVSSQAARIDLDATLASFMSTVQGMQNGRAWVYASGPAGLLKQAEAACVKQKRSLRGSNTVLDWHIASFEV